MSNLRRIPIKYIRDYIKKDYKLRDECYVCKCTDKLELHHMYSISQLFEGWCTKNKITEVESVEVIKEIPVEKFVEVQVEKLVQGDSKVIEIIKEVPVEVIKEVEKIVEVPVEIIKEIIVEKEPDDGKIKALEQTLQKLKTDNIEKDRKVKELEQTINQIQLNQPNQATYLRGSNLNNKLF